MQEREKVWNDFWAEDFTPWVREDSDQFLREHFEQIRAHLPVDLARCRAFVPLCGNSQATRILFDLGMIVTGVELIPKAIRSLRNLFFSDTSPTLGDSESFEAPRIRVIQADIFQFEDETGFDFIYDRAALVALNPKDQQTPYSKKIISLLKPGGLLFVEGFSSSQHTLGGPPYETPITLTRKYYQDLREVECFEQKLSTENPRFVEHGITELNQYQLLFKGG
ncbi:MAG: methyltransferase domain-containing protein [Bdellovibrionales bacterium]|nr:methyltransferase domain-containing protein [Bdellovibrionales bacterium]